MRLDQAVAARHPEVSRRKARELIAERRVLVNDRPIAVASREVSEKDRITIAPELPDVPVIAEKREWVAFAKPAGIPAQPTRDRRTLSLEEIARMRFGEIYLVHRIDTGTSGAIVFARTRRAAARLSELFAAREIRKLYLAVVEGHIDHEQTIESPIGGRDAHTVVRPLRRLESTTLIEAEILTGRTHQIRVHLKSIERPIVGDRRYGSTVAAPRMLLHAWKLSHPELGELVAPPPSEFLGFSEEPEELR